jgi:tetratricopeptide (TPR) repeat protein
VATPTAEVEQQQVGILTEALVASQVELARADLANHDYAAAAQRAEGVLKLHSGSAEAKEILEGAQKAQGQLEAGATEARAAFARGDAPAAADALSRVIALDPRHPVVGELSGPLNASFRKQADDGRRQMEAARTGAEQARAASQASFGEARQLFTAAETSYKREEFTVAAQKYQQARIAFERAKRESEEARAAAVAAAARPAPSARPPAVPEASPYATPSQAGTPAAPTSGPVPSPTIAAALTPAPTLAPVPSPFATLTPPTATTGDGSEAAVRKALADFALAIERKDIALYRSLMPSLSQDMEKALREQFKMIKSYVPGITVEDVRLEGDRATVRVMRHDVLDGRPMKAVPQTFRLARVGSSWQIQSIGQ